MSYDFCPGQLNQSWREDFYQTQHEPIICWVKYTLGKWDQTKDDDDRTGTLEMAWVRLDSATNEQGILIT